MRVKNRISAVDYRFEGGVQAGTEPGDVDVFAYQLDAEIGAHLPGDTVRVGVEGLIASGDDLDTADTNEAWDPMFPTIHRWLGTADIIGNRQNIAGGALHLLAHGPENLDFTGDVHLFVRPEVPEDVENYAGTEVDVGVLYNVGGGLVTRGSYALFMPNDGHYTGGNGEPVHFLELELRYDLEDPDPRGR
jgi:hypothetical protein